ncbi:MAG TPA: hypothetical protein PKI20_01325 [Verrucomicrobiota bacterium]|nr:hypothetical protein [Verrucomicrobiota bacterium]
MDRKQNMSQLDQLLALYKGAQTDAERRILLATARISSPGDFPRLEKMILREEIKDIPLDQLPAIISTRRGLSLQKAEEELRELILDHLLNFASPKPSPPSQASTAVGSAPRVSAPASSADESSPPETARVMIPDGSSRPEAILKEKGKVTPEGSQHEDLSPPGTATAFGRLQPRGIGG